VRWVAFASVVLVVGGIATAAALTLGDDSAADDQATPSTVAEDDEFGDLSLPEIRLLGSDDDARPLSNANPLRLWVGGDSLAGALGPALGELTADSGIVETHVDYKISSGLSSNVRNWPRTAEEAMDEEDPEVVVFMIGANDVQIVNSHDGDDDGIPDWEPLYREKVGAMMDLFLGDDEERVVLWIGSPTMRDDDRNDGAIELNRVMREEANKRSPKVVYVDAYRMFAGDDGGFTDTVETANGDSIRVRIGDGVHLTPIGAEYLARAVFALLDSRFEINEQADPENRIAYTISQGDGSGSSSGSSGSYRRPRSTTSSPPTTRDNDEPATSVPDTTVPAGTTAPPAPTTTPATTPETTVPPTAPPTTEA
jgi:hypothetical protein